MRALTSPLRAVLVLVALAGALAVATPQVASAASDRTVVLPMQLDWRIHHPANLCVVAGLATWPAEKTAGARSLSLVYRRRGAKIIQPLAGPPFDDAEYAAYGWRPGKDMHWQAVTRISRGGAVSPEECEEDLATARAAYRDVKLVIRLPPDARIVGKVEDAAGDPVEGVEVTAKGAGSDRTDADGGYEIDVAEKQRTYVVQPRLRGADFAPPRQSVTVRPGQTKQADFRTKVEREITGRVRLGCADRGSCGILPVKGVRIRAESLGKGASYSATTDEAGRYELRVKKGRYRVGVPQKAEMLRVRTKARRVDVTKRKTGSADFEVCGIKGGTSGLARMSAVTGGTWKGGNAECLNILEIGWRPSSSALSISWAGAPICSGAAGGNYVGDPKVLMKGRVIDPSQPGQNLVVGNAEVGFHYPVVSVHTGDSVNGSLRADGTGTVNAKYVAGLCTYQISHLALRR